MIFYIIVLFQGEIRYFASKKGEESLQRCDFIDTFKLFLDDAIMGIE